MGLSTPGHGIVSLGKKESKMNLQILIPLNFPPLFPFNFEPGESFLHALILHHDLRYLLCLPHQSIDHRPSIPKSQRVYRKHKRKRASYIYLYSPQQELYANKSQNSDNIYKNASIMNHRTHAFDSFLAFPSSGFEISYLKAKFSAPFLLGWACDRKKQILKGKDSGVIPATS